MQPRLGMSRAGRVLGAENGSNSARLASPDFFGVTC